MKKRFNATYVELDELYAESDFVSLHCPLTEETHHLVDADAFKKMKFTSIIINTSRGPVIDEQALVDALENNEIWGGAGLDVYENEPEIHPELLKMDNVVLLPHLGSATSETRERMSQMCARNIIEVLEGREPINPVY